MRSATPLSCRPKAIIFLLAVAAAAAAATKAEAAAVAAEAASALIKTGINSINEHAWTRNNNNNIDDDASGTLTLRTYSNTAQAGPPRAVRAISDAASFTIDDEDGSNGSGPCSAYLTGTIIFPSAGTYRFNCTFASTTVGWAWIDGHQVCNDGNTYRLEPGNHDNPLWIRRGRRKRPRRRQRRSRRRRQDDGSTTEEEEEEEEGLTTRPMPLRVKVMQNGDCGSSKRPSVGFSMSWTKMTPSPLAAAADDDGGGIGSSGNDTDARSRSSGRTTLLLPHLTAAEERRDELQSSLAQGWGTWYQPNILSITKLPEGAVVGIELCRISTSVCLTQAVPDGRFRHYDASARVDLHAWDRSYAQFYVGPRGGPEDVSTFVNANVSIELGASGETNEDLVVLVTPVACDGGLDCTDYELRLRGRYAWSRAGQVRSFATSEGTGIEFSSAGLGAFNITIINHNGIGEEDPNSAIIIPLLKGGIEFGTNVSNGRKHLGNARARELARIEESFGSKSEVAKAIQAAVMWTCIYTPVENGPLMTVSRSWGHSAPSGLDWTYVLYEWDTFFASLLAGLGDKRIAYSNLFQVVKSKTSAGFIPNFYFGGTSSQDRTEPPVGAKVLLEIYRKFRDDWVVELAFDDLLDWHRWFKHHRWLRKFGLIALGSWNQQQERTGMGDPGNDMQSARLESGLDNSPMYDGDFFDNSTTHLMELADVGMSSLFVQEAFALSELANAIGRPEATNLRKAGEAVARNIKMYLWDDDSGVYTNRFSNTSFHRILSPTSFYSMQSFAPSDPQVARMAKEWLLNSSRFCLRKGTIDKGPQDCFWGLPSISADDPTYLKPGVWNYWRGFTWGPMAILTLGNYAHLQLVQRAKKALSIQMENMMMKQWVDNRFICENYDPRKEFGGQCGGIATPFYHWGALTGFIGLVEDGHWGSTETPLSNSRISLFSNHSADELILL